MTKPTPVTSVTTARVRALLIPDSSSPGPLLGAVDPQRGGLVPENPSVTITSTRCSRGCRRSAQRCSNRNPCASRAPLTATPIHYDLDVFPDLARQLVRARR